MSCQTSPLFFGNITIKTAKDFGKALIFMHDSVPCANDFWSREFGLEIDEHIWSIPSLITKKQGYGFYSGKFCIIFIPQPYYFAR